MLNASAYLVRFPGNYGVLAGKLLACWFCFFGPAFYLLFARKTPLAAAAGRRVIPLALRFGHDLFHPGADFMDFLHLDIFGLAFERLAG